MDKDKMLNKITQLVTEDTEQLDNLIYEACMETASVVNNQDVESRIQFLEEQGFTLQEILKYISI